MSSSRYKDEFKIEAVKSIVGRGYNSEMGQSPLPLNYV